RSGRRVLPPPDRTSGCFRRPCGHPHEWRPPRTGGTMERRGRRRHGRSAVEGAEGADMATRDATPHWTAGLNSGTGTLTLDSSNSARFTVSFPRRIGEPEGTTSPEELIAAAQASCLAMNLAGTLEKEGLTANSIDANASVTVEPSNGGLSINNVDVTLRASVDGIDEERFSTIAQKAKDTCPVSRALAGTTITLHASLA